MIRLAIAGAAGRMGRCVLNLVEGHSEIEVVAALTAPLSPHVGQAVHFGQKSLDTTDKLEVECDCLLDVSMPLGTIAWVSFCEHREIPMVIGVTGHTENQLTRIKEASHQIPVLFAANFSVGINAILDVLTPLIGLLGDGYDLEIVETHHRGKMDSPSGTALRLADELREASRKLASGSKKLVYGRHGNVGPRRPDEIGIHAVRMGDVVGQHEIHLSGPGETITIRHAAHSRDAFAAGALRAVEWVVRQGAGFYTMRDCLRDKT